MPMQLYSTRYGGGKKKWKFNLKQKTKTQPSGAIVDITDHFLRPGAFFFGVGGGWWGGVWVSFFTALWVTNASGM